MNMKMSRYFSTWVPPLLGSAVFFGTVGWSGACGPFPPEQILLSHRVVLRTPVGDYAQEVLALTEEDGAPAFPPGLTRLPAAELRPTGHDYYEPPDRDSSDKEAAELRDALADTNVPPGERPGLVSAYKTFRAALAKEAAAVRPPVDHYTVSDFRFDEQARAIRTDVRSPASDGSPVLPAALADGLPGEWRDYLEGAACFWRRDLPGARAAWEHLLARPAAQRQFCSTRAAYMLARVEDEPDGPPEERARRYQRVRSLRAEGCRDALNLASDSLGWEARIALDRQDFAAAARLYYLQAWSGGGLSDPMASSLRTVAELLLKDGPDSPPVAAAARDPFLRRAVTLYLACRRFFDDADATFDDQDATDKRLALERGWMAQLSQGSINVLREATPIAWSAYQQGDYAGAAAWLTKAPAANGLACWLRAKLALRDGHPDAAAKLFDQAVRAFPVEIRATYNNLDDAMGLAHDGAVFRANQFQADLGVVSLSRNDYVQALSALLRSGFWRDAADVAERVMTPDELLAYVRKNFPAAPPPAPVPSPTPEEAPADTPADSVESIQAKLNRFSSANPAAYALRYLLARRLAREGRYAEARGYYPPPLLPKLDEYTAALRLAQDDRQPRPKRADAFWRAARIERWLGMELFGTEDDPDWLVVGGSFEDDPYLALRAEVGSYAPSSVTIDPPPTPSPPFLPPVSAEEKRRVRQHPVHPEIRYHYRPLAAELAWKAAALMPDQQEATARVLAAGGHWLETVGETKAADRFYLALLRRCNRTPTGQEADRTGKIPEGDREEP